MEKLMKFNQSELFVSDDERAEFEAFKKEKETRAKQERAKREREAYKQLVAETIETVFPKLEKASRELGRLKSDVYESFKKALELKAEIFEKPSEQRTHTFTCASGDKRILLGQYVSDGYDDTVDAGIVKVKGFIGSLARDEDSRLLVSAVLRLLARDRAGNLKASRVMQLKRMAQDSGNEQFIDGVRIIEEAFRPVTSKFFVRAERKNKLGAWENIPLGMTEA